MLFTVHPARRAVVGVLSALATATVVAAPSASADPPNCTAADLAGVAAGVSAATSAYLFTHPDANAFMTGLKGQPVADIRAQVQQYLNDNPQTRAEIQAIRAPLAEIRSRCGAGSDVPLQ
ncbi:MAG: heme-binding protein [Mycobacterium sp.]|jgi:hemophore-related protein